MGIVDTWAARARLIKRDTYALFLACRDPRTPWAAKVFGVAIVAYAFSPIDLIPDFIPVLGMLDDLILIPLGLALVFRMIPSEVVVDARARTDVEIRSGSRVAAVVIVLVWIALAALVVYGAARAFGLI